MTPEQLKQMALEATKKEFDSIIAEMQKAAKTGSFICRVQNITDGAKHQLKEAGYEVESKIQHTRGMYGSTGSKYYEIRFAK